MNELKQKNERLNESYGVLLVNVIMEHYRRKNGQIWIETVEWMNGQIWIETEKQKIGHSYFGLVSDLNKS